MAIMYNVLIIGCGSIGALKPDKYDSPDTENILTHCHAVKKHDKFRLWGVMDSDYDKMMKAARKWGCMGFPGFKALGKIDDEIDIAVIATPIETHYRIYRKIKDRNLKAIIIEKPCGIDYDMCNLMKGERVVVNYTRRFLPRYKNFKKEFESGACKILSCVVYYVRGLLRDGCHAIDLCRYFFGEILDVKKLSTGPDDYSPDDTTDCIWMQAERCPNIVIIPGDGRVADCFDFEIMTDKGMICLYEHGAKLFIRGIEKERVYGDYDSLTGKQIKYNFDMGFSRQALLSLYDNVAGVIEGKEKPICTVEDALIVHEIIEKVRN